MNCPGCKAPDSSVPKTIDGPSSVIRARVCRACRGSWRTFERLEAGSFKPRGEIRGEKPYTAALEPAAGGFSASKGGKGVSSSDLVSGSLFPDLSDPSSEDVEISETTREKRGRGRPSKGEYTPDFERFWGAISVRTGNKQPAFAEWVKIISPNVERIISQWELWLTTDGWKRGYVPHVRKWLRERGWENDPDPSEFRARAVASKTSGNIDVMRDWLDKKEAAR